MDHEDIKMFIKIDVHVLLFIAVPSTFFLGAFCVCENRAESSEIASYRMLKSNTTAALRNLSSDQSVFLQHAHTRTYTFACSHTNQNRDVI